MKQRLKNFHIWVIVIISKELRIMKISKEISQNITFNISGVQ